MEEGQEDRMKLWIFHVLMEPYPESTADSLSSRECLEKFQGLQLLRKPCLWTLWDIVSCSIRSSLVNVSPRAVFSEEFRNVS